MRWLNREHIVIGVARILKGKSMKDPEEPWNSSIQPVDNTSMYSWSSNRPSVAYVSIKYGILGPDDEGICNQNTKPTASPQKLHACSTSCLSALDFPGTMSRMRIS